MTGTDMKNIAVLFPGIGYTCDKPLLYYSGKMAAKLGYEVLPVSYGGFRKDAKGSRDGMEDSFRSALAQAETLLEPVRWEEYGDILFISKSIGTIVASCFAKSHGISVRSILYTPLAETFAFAENPACAFHGTHDPWVKTGVITAGCREKGIPLFITENANHSLETGVISQDIRNLGEVMETAERFIVKGDLSGSDRGGTPAAT